MAQGHGRASVASTRIAGDYQRDIRGDSRPAPSAGCMGFSRARRRRRGVPAPPRPSGPQLAYVEQKGRHSWASSPRPVAGRR